MIPARFAPILFGLILSGLMSLIVSGLSTARTVGLIAAFPGLWLSNWAVSWAIAFPTVLVVAPAARRIVAHLVRKD
jgi:protein-S-isoprenylcysteine O-methyltransferase Ste14